MVAHLHLVGCMPCKYDYLVSDYILAHNRIDTIPLNYCSFGRIFLATFVQNKKTRIFTWHHYSFFFIICFYLDRLRRLFYVYFFLPNIHLHRYIGFSLMDVVDYPCYNSILVLSMWPNSCTHILIWHTRELAYRMVPHQNCQGNLHDYCKTYPCIDKLHCPV